jgi:hypothetical protein
MCDRVHSPEKLEVVSVTINVSWACRVLFGIPVHATTLQSNLQLYGAAPRGACSDQDMAA